MLWKASNGSSSSGQYRRSTRHCRPSRKAMVTATTIPKWRAWMPVGIRRRCKPLWLANPCHGASIRSASGRPAAGATPAKALSWLSSHRHFSTCRSRFAGTGRHIRARQHFLHRRSRSRHACVAGTIAARRSNGLGVVGVAPKARLMAVKVLARDGYSRGDSVALGITWAANNGAQVINLSLGSGQASDSLRRAVMRDRAR